MPSMEPAAERREHRHSGQTPNDPMTPHWSPPLKGGSTDAALSRIGVSPCPHWSPPLKGGSTTIPLDQVFLEPVPQWSPPSKGGSTPRGQADPGHDPLPSMEPAVERREHGVDVLAG